VPARRKPPAILASDAERDHALVVLREAAAEGRLTLEEFASRSGLALEARTRNDLVGVTADLPAPAAQVTTPPHELYAVFTSVRRAGRWRVGQVIAAYAIMGSVHLDLRQAVIESPVLVIHAYALLGNVRILVPEGVSVEMEGFGGEARLSETAMIRPGAPVVRIAAYSFFGTVQVRDRPGVFTQLWKRISG